MMMTITPEHAAKIVDADLATRMAEHDRTVIVVEVEGRGLTVNDLRELFDAVADKAHWKNPISAVIPAHKASRTQAAIQFYHGGPKPRLEWINGDTVRIIGKGYAC